MKKQTFLYACAAAFGSVIGFLLRNLELQVALDRSTMLMDFGAASLFLLLICAASLAAFVLLGRNLEKPMPTVGYMETFGWKPGLYVSAGSALLMVIGAILTLRRVRSGDSRVYGVLAVLAFLAAMGWLLLALSAKARRPGGCRLWAAALPELMTCFLLVLFYKAYAPQPALLFTLYPFLGLCAALAACHLVAGYTVKICRPRLTLFCCGFATVLCITSIPGVQEADYKLYLLALAIQSFLHGFCLFREPDEPLILEETEADSIHIPAPGEDDEEAADETESAPEENS